MISSWHRLTLMTSNRCYPSIPSFWRNCSHPWAEQTWENILRPIAGSLPPVSSSPLWPPPPICREPPLPWQHLYLRLLSQKSLGAFLSIAFWPAFQKIYHRMDYFDKQSKGLPLLVWTIPSQPVWVGAHCSTTWNKRTALSNILCKCVHHLKQLRNDLIRRATLSSSSAGFWASSNPFAPSTPGWSVSTECKRSIEVRLAKELLCKWNKHLVGEPSLPRLTRTGGTL